MKAIIVGGGIGGLATAAALDQIGWEVEVLERAGELTEVGAGLSVWPNGLRALDALGKGDAVRRQALMETQAGIQDPQGRWLSRIDTEELERRYGQLAMVHRADLLHILRSAVREGSLRTGVTVKEARVDGSVVHSDGESRGDLVVGADGIRSVVRRSIWPDSAAPRYAGYAAWRLVTPPVPISQGVESWGRGERFGYAALPDRRVYAFAVASTPPGAPEGGLAELRRRFGEWHDPIPSLLAAAGDTQPRHDDLYELPPLHTYVSGKVALVGDAAHAMTPNLGQGACQALEDAVVLASSLADGDGLEAYDRARRRRTQMVARRSRKIGTVAQWSSPLAVKMRNAALRRAPRSSFIRSLAPVMDWTS